MIYCFDTYYFDDKARTSCVGIDTWTAGQLTFEKSETIAGIEEYESGSFYKRELPCIQSMLSNITLNSNDIIVVDGFVVLDDFGKPGLGGYLYEWLVPQIPVIGVAKNNFATIDNLKREIFRGESSKPLYVTAKGMDLDQAANYVKSMHGNYRIPTILKMVDQYCREI